MNILVSNYTNTHITFNKEEYIGCLEPTIEGYPYLSNLCLIGMETKESPEAPTMHCITTEKMTLEKVEPDTFKLPQHKLKQHIETRLTVLLKEYDS